MKNHFLFLFSRQPLVFYKPSTMTSLSPIHQASLVLGRMQCVFDLQTKPLSDGGMSLKATIRPISCVLYKTAHLVLMCTTSAPTESGSYTSTLSFDGPWACKIGPSLKTDFRASASKEGVTLAARLRDVVLTATSYIAFLENGKRMHNDEHLFDRLSSDRCSFFLDYIDFIHSHLRIKGSEEEKALWKHAIDMMWDSETRAMDNCLTELDVEMKKIYSEAKEDSQDEEALAALNKEKSYLVEAQETLSHMLGKLSSSSSPLHTLARMASADEDDLTFAFVNRFFCTFGRLLEETYPGYSTLLRCMDNVEDQDTSYDWDEE